MSILAQLANNSDFAQSQFAFDPKKINSEYYENQQRFKYFTPTLITILSVIIDEKSVKKEGRTDTMLSMRLHYQTEVSDRMETLSYSVAYVKEGETLDIQKHAMPDYSLYQNLVLFVLGGVTPTLVMENVRDKWFCPEQEAFCEGIEKRLHAPAFANKQIGVILAKDFYIDKKKNTVRYKPFIFEIYNPKSLLTVRDVENNRSRNENNKDTSHLEQICHEAQFTSKEREAEQLATLENLLKQTTDENQTRQALGQTMDDNAFDIFDMPNKEGLHQQQEPTQEKESTQQPQEQAQEDKQEPQETQLPQIAVSTSADTHAITKQVMIGDDTDDTQNAVLT